MLIILLGVIQTTIIAPYCVNAWFKLDLIVLMISFLGVKLGKSGGCLFGVVGGFFEDVFSANPLGTRALVCGMAGLSIGMLSEWMYRKDVGMQVFAALWATIMVFLVQGLVENIFLRSGENQRLLINLFWPMLVTHLVIGPFFFPVMERIYGRSSERRFVF